MHTPADPVVAARDIGRSYGTRRALDGLTLDVPAGSVFGLLGPNGSGKSTFISILAAMETPPEGELRVFGSKPAPALRARLGTVFQENTSDPLMTVMETLRLAGRLFGVSGERFRQRSMELLTAFGLEARAKDPVSSLSGGMRRRLEMARALLHDPELLLLDEPTTGVDPEERRALWGALLERERGSRTILIATNDLAEADSVCDVVAFIQAGRVVAKGTPAELKAGLRREALRVTWEQPSEQQLAVVRSWPGAGEVTLADGVVHISVDDASSFAPLLFELAPGAIRAVSIDTSTLEDAYFQHVGQRARVTAEVTA